MIVFTLTGLWHGANFTFVLWGVFNGLCLLTEDLWARLAHKQRGEALCPAPLGHAYTFIITVMLFTMFRADTVGAGWAMMGRQLFGWSFGAAQMAEFWRFLTPLFLVTLAAALVLCTPAARTLWRRLQNGKAARAAEPLSYLGTLALLGLCILDLSSASYNPFIYFRF